MPMHPFSIRQALLAAACALSLLGSAAPTPALASSPGTPPSTPASTPSGAEPPNTATNTGFSLPLRLKWTPGEVIRTRTTMYRRTIFSHTGDALLGRPMAPIESDEHTVIVTKLKVLSVDPRGSATVESVAESVRAEGQAPTKFEFDSTRPTNDVPKGTIAFMLAELLKDPITLVIAPDGAVEFQDLDATVDRMMSKAAASTPGSSDMPKELTQSVKDMLGRNKGLIQDSFRLIPAPLTGRSTRLGETWEAETEMSFPMVNFGRRFVTTSTFAAIEMLNNTPVARISMRTESSPSSVPPPSTGSLVKIRSLDSDISADVWLNTNLGRVVKVVAVNMVSMEMSSEINGKALVLTTKTATTTTTEDISSEPVPTR